MNKQQY